jgi:hypothetical protein
MKLIVVLAALLSSLAFAGSPVSVDILTPAERNLLNNDFMCILKSYGIFSGDVVGNGSGDVVGNGSGDVVGNGSGDIVGNGSCGMLGNRSGDVVGNGSGDVVGNGGGIIEGTLQYLLQNLPDYLEQSILYTDFEFPADTATALMDIHRSIVGRKTPLRLEFVSGPEAQHFFKDEHDQEVRAAKTGFSEMFPIYINIEYLYAESITSRKALITLLVHEIGHQVGYESHSFLDIVGAEVARVVDRHQSFLDSVYFADGFVDVQYLNYDMNGAKATLFVQFEDQERFISGWDQKAFKTKCGQYHPIGYRYRNLSWENYIDLINNPSLEQALIKGIIELNCGGTRGEIKKQFIPFEINVMVKNNILNVLRKPYQL